MVPGDTDRASPVRERRKEHRLTQAELADLVGVSRQTIIAVEQGDYAPSVYLALRIAKALDRTVEELFTNETGDSR
ncbi:transcriptional regulator [Arthrobacter pityocampae]|uniref:Transcriptional regulator n=1 Tax=Arthrobacter pityocampae TaxID=547334 RepID=A0A2S5J0P9_9MICC|nr:helix-turn-helix transcriptional regulator [Arthrobacter pityocampae]PPB50363.1 transcriptional regulator [Arthrobacter pityocampae]